MKDSISGSNICQTVLASVEAGLSPPYCQEKEDSMFKEFKEFAVRGNAIDLAVGVIIGGAFGKIVSSLVNDILMPPIGLLIGNINFNELFFNLSGAKFPTLTEAKEAGAATLNYGLFIQSIVDFLIVAVAIFVLVKQLNRLKREPAKASPSEKECPFCVSAIPVKASRCPHCTSDLKAA